MTSRVGVLIPVFNDQFGIDRTLESVLRNVCGPVAVLIVDDGSEPPIKIDEFNYKQEPQVDISVIRSEQNQGIVAALNIGLRELERRGTRYVARVDAGDLIVGNRIERQASFLDEHPDLALVASYVQFDDLTGEAKFVHKPPVGAENIRRALHFNNCLVHTSVMFRLDLVLRSGVYSSEFPAAEDYEMFFRLASEHPVDIIPEVLVRSELDPHGISLSRRHLQLKSRFRIQLRYFDFLEPKSYLGLLATVLFMLVPASAVNWVKSRRSKPTVAA